MSTPSKSKTEFLHDLAGSSITGSVDGILRVCKIIGSAKKSLPAGDFKALREDSPYSEKVWSKLLQIGLDDRLEGIKDHFPPLYTTIHLIHCLTNEELSLGVRDGHIHPNVTQGSLNRWIRHQRFQKGSEVIPEDFTALVQVMTPPDLSEEVLERFKQELEGFVSRYGFRTQYEDDQSMVEVRQQRSQERSQVLVQRLTQDLQSTWEEADADLKNLFSLSSLEDFVLAPMSSFTGFLNRLRGGRDGFWSKHGTDYIHKVALEYLRTDNRGQRFNYRRRMKEVAEKYPQLAEKSRDAQNEWMKY
ncbi:hypothetical protein KBZ15_07290 [Cyanobium sp. BA20m-p-22]|uniref:hypothetical protein n=1 Tax=Cyanobium sp. BA20m-p-22 TaxID=2823704 RepID=UPI0020CBA703|nr:hypothetical protein [Cyanobium sp. BA20m-p-22]MCP9909709.1 hypothetical protein [Cyanobium sp. BA20m-p-22]